MSHIMTFITLLGVAFVNLVIFSLKNVNEGFPPNLLDCFLKDKIFF